MKTEVVISRHASLVVDQAIQVGSEPTVGDAHSQDYLSPRDLQTKFGWATVLPPDMSDLKQVLHHRLEPTKTNEKVGKSQQHPVASSFLTSWKP